MTNNTEVEMIRISEDFSKAFKLLRLCRWLDTEDYPDEDCPFQDDFPFAKEECPPIEDIKEDISNLVDANPFSTMEFYALNEMGGKYLPESRLEIMYSFTNMPQLCVMFADTHHADFESEKKFLNDTIKYAYMFGDKEFFKEPDSEHGDDYGEFILRKLYKISTCSYHNKNDTRALPDWVDTGKWVFNGLAYQHHILKNSQPEDNYDLKWEEDYKGVIDTEKIDFSDYTEAYPNRTKYNFYCCLFPYECAIVDSIKNGEDAGEFVHKAKANYMAFHLNED
jgi:hypothetical protein